MINISFIIPAFNAGEMLVQSVESILNNNYEKGDEIIIVDDASTDNTLKIALELKSINPDKIIVLQHSINKGSAAASRNTAIENSRNGLIFCLDADNYLVPGSIAALKSYLINNNLEAAAFGEIHYFNSSTGIVEKIWKLNQKFNFIDNINSTNKTPSSSGNYLFYMRVWEKVGRYDEFVGGAYDSWAFGVKKLAHNIKFETMPNSYYMHRFEYDSTFVKEHTKTNVSLLILRILLPYIHFISPLDYKYITSRLAYRNWMSYLDIMPLNGGSVSTGFFVNFKKIFIIITSLFYELRIKNKFKKKLKQ
jgi:glycosyltransferase involved in cell wall biosynthesis